MWSVYLLIPTVFSEPVELHFFTVTINNCPPFTLEGMSNKYKFLLLDASDSVHLVAFRTAKL